jgi:tetratricopeptide (TPR) repeat protein
LIINADFSWLYLCARRYDEAEAQARKVLEIDPRFFLAHYYLGEILQFTGRSAEATAEYQKAFDLTNDPYPLAALGQIYARTGKVEEARKILSQLDEEAKSRFIAPYARALLLTGLGEREQAIDELERAYREKTGAYLFVIKVDPFLDDLRGNPRFEALVKRIISPKAEPTK